jgi:cysteine-rich repeat protein
MASAALECNDDNPCTDDGCDPQTGCTATANSAACSDGDPCSLNDSCDDGSCQAGPDALPCSDDDTCTEDSCAPGEGCTFLPITPCCGNAVVEEGESCDDGNDNNADDCSNQCTEGGISPAVTLVDEPDVSTVFNTIERTFFYSNNLTNGIWHGPSNQILTGHYSNAGYYQHGATESGYPSNPNNGVGMYGRMVHMPSSGTVVWTNSPSNDGMGPASFDQLRIGTIDPATGALSSGSPVQFSDGYQGECNVLSSSATDLFILVSTSQIRQYATTYQSNALTFIKTITLTNALPDNATCAGGHCYGGSFAWDGKYFYVAEAQTGSNKKNYMVFDGQGTWIGNYSITGPGGINGVYFDWSVGRYASHDGYGDRQGGVHYGCNGCSDDSQVYAPPSPYHQ